MPAAPLRTPLRSSRWPFASSRSSDGAVSCTSRWPFTSGSSRFGQFGVFEPVPQTTNAEQIARIGRLGLNLLAEIEDVRVHGAIGDGDIAAPGRPNQSIPAQHAAAMLQ